MTWELIEKTARHYAQLAQQPGWFQHCKHQIIKMESGLNNPWMGLRKRWGALLTEAGFQIPANEQDNWWVIQSQHEKELARKRR